MKKHYLPPQIRLSFSQNPAEQPPPGQRQTVVINESCTMAIPDSIDKEKARRFHDEEIKKRREEGLRQKTEILRLSRKGSSRQKDPVDLKYQSCRRSIDELKTKEREFEKYLRMINRQQTLLKPQPKVDETAPKPQRTELGYQSQSTVPPGSPTSLKRRNSITKVATLAASEVQKRASQNEFFSILKCDGILNGCQ